MPIRELPDSGIFFTLTKVSQELSIGRGLCFVKNLRIFDNIHAAGKVLIGAATAHEAAESTRRLKGWPTTDTELNTLIRNAGNTLRQRSRHLIATNGYTVNGMR